MWVHVISRLYEPPVAVSSDIYDISIPECGLFLVGGKDITARRPYPNKRYLVACRKKGRKAMDGFLLKVDGFLPYYTVITRWVVDGEIITHVVKHEVLDRDFDTASDNLLFWNRMSGKKFQPRWPECYSGEAPVARQPSMDVMSPMLCGIKRPPEVRDVITQHHRVRLRVEYLKLHTLENERIYHQLFNNDSRTPGIQDAFEAVVTDVPRLSISLKDSLTANILLVPMPQEDSDSNYPILVGDLAAMMPDVYLSFSRNNEVLAEFLPWGEVISGSDTIEINPSLILDANDLYDIDLQGWELMMKYGMFPTEMILQCVD